MLKLDPRTRRRPANLSIREDVMRAAKELGVNASQVAEQALTEAVRKAAAERWLAENREAIDEHNSWVEANGLPLRPVWME